MWSLSHGRNKNPRDTRGWNVFIIQLLKMPFLKETWGGGKTQNSPNKDLFHRIPAFSGSTEILQKWVCSHLSENQRSGGRLNMQMRPHNSRLWMRLRSQPAASGGTWLPGCCFRGAPGSPGWRNRSAGRIRAGCPRKHTMLGCLGWKNWATWQDGLNAHWLTSARESLVWAVLTEILGLGQEARHPHH